MVPFYWSYTVFALLQELGIFYLRNRAQIVEKSIQIILMMKNTVKSTVKYIMLEFKIEKPEDS